MVLSMLMTSIAFSSATHCDRNLFPKRGVLDTSTISSLAASEEECSYSEEAIQCVNKETKAVVCFKCKANNKWKKLKENVYQCAQY
jgi:hypothetical protein